MEEKQKNWANTVHYIRDRPQFSTILSASMLAAIWTLAWLLVFFGSLFFLSESTTSLYGLFIGMWLSTCVEAIIRFFENTEIAAQFGKPGEKNPKGDNLDYGVWRAVLLFCVGAVIVLIVGFSIAQDWLVIPAISFDGVKRGAQIDESLNDWWIALQNPVTITMITACFLLRIAIYKRVANPIRKPK